MSRLPQHSGSSDRTGKSLGKSQRISARVSPNQKQLLQRAADFEHRSLTDFMVESGLRRAEEVIRRQEVITLSEQGARSFMEALYKPIPANSNLRRAAKRYKKDFGDR